MEIGTRVVILTKDNFITLFPHLGDDGLAGVDDTSKAVYVIDEAGQSTVPRQNNEGGAPDFDILIRSVCL